MTDKKSKRQRQTRWGEVSKISEWLRAALKAQNKSQAWLGRQLGQERDVINKVLKERRRLTSEELIKISTILKTPPPIIGDEDANDPLNESWNSERIIRQVKCVGEVQGGVWKEMAFEDFDEFEIPYTADPRWPEGAVKALRVRGDSINRKAEDGDFVAVLDVNAALRAFKDGDWVVCHRARGGLIESTVKQVRRAGDIWQLWPASTDPRFQEPITLEADGMNADDEVRVVGFVLDFIKSATRF